MSLIMALNGLKHASLEYEQYKLHIKKLTKETYLGGCSENGL